MNRIYVDGSCKGNGSKNNTGGFGIVIVDENNNIIKCFSFSSIDTTNNREEMKAVIWAFANIIKKDRDNWVICSDSTYTINVFSNWMWGWKKKNWTKSDKKTPENLDIVKTFDKLCDIFGHVPKFEHVKGHNGQKYNELADKLATKAISPEEVMTMEE